MLSSLRRWAGVTRSGVVFPMDVLEHSPSPILDLIYVSVH
jgi:hypothetical protein